MFTGFETSPAIQSFLSQTMTGPVIVYGIMALFGTTKLAAFAYARVKNHKKMNEGVFESVSMTATILILGICILTLASQTYNPFIYFRF